VALNIPRKRGASPVRMVFQKSGFSERIHAMPANVPRNSTSVASTQRHRVRRSVRMPRARTTIRPTNSKATHARPIENSPNGRIR
jgi:hypothetical protein